MFNKKVTIGRKICKSSIIAQELRKKKKELADGRKTKRKSKKRTKLQKRLIAKQKNIELHILMNERLSISYEDGMILYDDIKEVLNEMGYSNIHVSGRLRRKTDIVPSVTLVICDERYIKKSVDPETFLQKMAEREYLSCSVVTRDKYRGASNVFMVEGIPVIIHIANPDNLGAVLLYTTGNMRFVSLVAYHARRRCLLSLTKNGVFLNSECLASKTEEEIFNALDLEYYPPEERTLPTKTFLKRL